MVTEEVVGVPLTTPNTSFLYEHFKTGDESLEFEKRICCGSETLFYVTLQRQMRRRHDFYVLSAMGVINGLL